MVPDSHGVYKPAVYRSHARTKEVRIGDMYSAKADTLSLPFLTSAEDIANAHYFTLKRGRSNRCGKSILVYCTDKLLMLHFDYEYLGRYFRQKSRFCPNIQPVSTAINWLTTIYHCRITLGTFMRHVPYSCAHATVKCRRAGCQNCTVSISDSGQLFPRAPLECSMSARM